MCINGPMKLYRCFPHKNSPWSSLAFAYSVSQARTIFYREAPCEVEWVDTCAYLMRGDLAHLEVCRDKDVPHLVNDVPSCPICGNWGVGPVSESGHCLGCAEGLLEREEC